MPIAPSGITITPSVIQTQVTPTRIITDSDSTNSLVSEFLIPFISSLSGVTVPSGCEPVSFSFRYLPNGKGLSLINFAPTEN